MNVGTNIIFSLKNPKECGDFEIRRRLNSLYKTDYKMLNSPKHNPNYGLATEHVLETQLISLFSEEISKQAGKMFIDPSDKSGLKMVDFCTYMTAYWADSNKNFLPEIGGVSKLGVQWIADQFPITKSWLDEFFLLPGAPNGIKGRVSHSTFMPTTLRPFLANTSYRHGVTIKFLSMTWRTQSTTEIFSQRICFKNQNWSRLLSDLKMSCSLISIWL